MKSRQLTILVLSILLLVSVCAMQGLSTPPSEDSYISIPFKKVVNPAFHDEVKSKSIRTTVTFFGVRSGVMDLPTEYKQGWVRLFLMDQDDQTVSTDIAVIQKDKSDLVFELKRGDRIEIIAYLVPVITRSGITGSTQKNILFRISSLRPAVQQERTSPSITSAESHSYQDVIYGKLTSEAFVGDYKNVMVHFKAMFVGEWTETGAYRLLGGIHTADRVFINHRDVSYAAQETGLGSSDMAFPGFALSVPKRQSDIVYEIKRGDIIEVWGRTEEVDLLGQRGLHVLADRIVKQTH